MKKQISNETGFTLLEVMTSVFIMGFSMLLLLHLAMVALDGNTWASGTTTSTQLLQEKLEELRSLGSPESGADTVNEVYRNWTVTNAGSHLRQVVLTATWYTPDSLAHTNSITTLIKTDSI